MKRVTFDFDGTLDMKIVQEYAKSLIDRGVDVWICTARFEPGYEHLWGGKEWSNADLDEVAETLGITKVIYGSIIFHPNSRVDGYKFEEYSSHDSIAFHTHTCTFCNI